MITDDVYKDFCAMTADAIVRLTDQHRDNSMFVVVYNGNGSFSWVESDDTGIIGLYARPTDLLLNPDGFRRMPRNERWGMVYHSLLRQDGLREQVETLVAKTERQR